MPRSFTVDACRMVPSTRSTTHTAETVDEACIAALGDDRWRKSEIGDPDHVGHTYIAGVREGDEAGAELPVPAHLRSRLERRSDMFDALLAAIEEAARGNALPPRTHALIEKARAVRDDAPDPPPLDIMTPWGVADEIVFYGDGCVFCSTSSHGGFLIDESRNSEMPGAWRRAGGWYEEDVDAHHVIVTFSHLFNADQVRRSKGFIAAEEDHSKPRC